MKKFAVFLVAASAAASTALHDLVEEGYTTAYSEGSSVFGIITS